ncbi:MAG: tol-pal system protein YbgF [Proteobacteria bacterium]|nr:tol-pal system protein YbgF [Pseudomonadota bacterium]
MNVKIWLAASLVLTGCATQGAMSDRDKVALQNSIEELEAAQLRQKTKIAGLEKRVSQLEDMVAMLTRRTSLESREVVKIEPEELKADSRYERVLPDDVVYDDIVISEDKKRAYFGRSSSQPSSPASQPSSAARRPYDSVTDERLPAANPSRPDVSVSPMLAYQEGIDLYRQGKFVEARAKFEKFLATKPEESYVDNALYWIGECFYGEGYFHEAAEYFHRIIKEYPNANKVPDALLKVSLTYQKLGRLDSAQEMLRYLMDAFPGTEAARIGKEKYQELTSNP